jgi:hypothetical protein
LRGGLTLPGGLKNPFPRRNVPWGADGLSPRRISVNYEGQLPHISHVAHFPDDRSPLGIFDLAGNAQEWTSSLDSAGLRITRGGNWAETSMANLVDFVAPDNPRPPGSQVYTLGLRCVADEISITTASHF